jgi:hypothetical protein
MHFVIMKKVLIILFGVLAVTTSGCRDNKKEAQSLELLRLRQDSIRRADEQRILELQLKAREDSLAMALANTFESASTTQYSAYYVVVGSFKYRDNANSYLTSMRQIFRDAEIVRHGSWNLVCVGGKFGSYSSAASTLRNVVSQLSSGGGAEEEVVAEEAEEEEEEEDEEDEEGGDEEEAAEDEDSGDDEEEEEEEDEEEEAPQPQPRRSVGGGGRVGQAWVIGI